MEIQKELEELDMEILSLMEEWEELENELKTLKNKNPHSGLGTRCGFLFAI